MTGSGLLMVLSGRFRFLCLRIGFRLSGKWPFGLVRKIAGPVRPGYRKLMSPHCGGCEVPRHYLDLYCRPCVSGVLPSSYFCISGHSNRSFKEFLDLIDSRRSIGTQIYLVRLKTSSCRRKHGKADIVLRGIKEHYHIDRSNRHFHSPSLFAQKISLYPRDLNLR